ncbi:MAG: sterol desaturase family protein [Gammaproteobacteria bacterium]
MRVLAWPGLLLSCSTILAIGFARGQETLFFNLSYAWIVCWLLLAERVLGYRADWQQADGQLRADLAHTVLNKGLVQLLIVSILATGVLERDQPSGIGTWPLAAQVAFGLIASEFGLYWAHRLAHEWPLLWRFHAIHHSVRKLWLVNTGRFHFVDSLESVLFSLPFLLLTGLSMDAIVWVSAITAYIGILTHCNVDMRCGPLSLVFNTPELHRWHHSIDPAIGNNNYGENLMLWDQLFGTYYRRPGQPVEGIGIADYMPPRFLEQLALPFRWRRVQAAFAGADEAA